MRHLFHLADTVERAENHHSQLAANEHCAERTCEGPDHGNRKGGRAQQQKERVGLQTPKLICHMDGPSTPETTNMPTAISCCSVTPNGPTWQQRDEAGQCGSSAPREAARGDGILATVL